MNDEINYQNNPLHGVSLKALLNEIVDHYGFEILFAYLNINCFKTNPSVDSSVKFLKKTQWAREKVEVFYLYEFKNLPRASSAQFALSPRDRVIPEDQVTGDPKELSLEDAERLRELRDKKSAERRQTERPRNRNDNQRGGYSSEKKSSSTPWGGRESSKPSKPSNSTTEDRTDSKVDPWANWKK